MRQNVFGKLATGYPMQNFCTARVAAKKCGQVNDFVSTGALSNVDSAVPNIQTV
jgi:hypothetical protein